MRFKIYLPLIRWKWAYNGHLWRRSSNEGNTFAKGMWRVVRKRSIDQMITRSFDQGEKAENQNKTMWPKGTGHSNAIRAAVQLCWRWCDIQQSPRLLWTKMGGWQSRYRSRWSDCQTDSRCSKAADKSCAYQKGIWVQKKSSVIGGRRIFLTKMRYRRRQGYLPKLVTKMNEIPTTFESSVVK